MSWDVVLERDGKTVEVDGHAEGGTYVQGGTTAAELNITYNYGIMYRLALRGETQFAAIETEGLLGWINGKTAGETIDILILVTDRLGRVPDYKPKKGWRDELQPPRCDYWTPTPGNAGFAASILLDWALQHPDAVWRVF